MSSHRGRPRPNRHGRFGEVKPPIWARPEPRGARAAAAALSLDQIADVALAIADAEGLDAVSIRRIARELGSGAMSLYHYFDSRDELLDLMADRVAAEMVVPDLPAEWRPALRAIAFQSRDTFRRHPWLHSALRASPRVTPEPAAPHRAVLAERSRGWPTRASTRRCWHGIVVAVDDYTIGFTVREAAVEDPGNRAAGIADALQEPYVRALLESGEFPLLSEFVGDDVDLEIEDRFELGLDWLLDGFAAKIGR